jgi:GT2 family glycosyltransferase
MRPADPQDTARVERNVGAPTISVVIPTFNREEPLLQTIDDVLRLRGPRHELIIVDQTERHGESTAQRLQYLADQGRIRWVRLSPPSITRAMNSGALAATGDVILYLDDDVQPSDSLIEAHASAHASGHRIVAGRVVQPWERDAATPTVGADARRAFSFSSNQERKVDEVMGGNVSIRRELLLELGGFDENFVRVAYRFEAEFSARARARGEEIVFVPEASLFHLKVASGGTRHFGDHLRTWLPAHSVGAYYYILRADRAQGRMAKVLMRMIRSIRTRHHAAHPWHIPATLCAEMSGLVWAIWLNHCGPRLLQQRFGATFE